MKASNILVMTTLAAFIAAGPALAVKKVSNSDDSSTVNKQDDKNRNDGQDDHQNNSQKGTTPSKPVTPDRPDRTPQVKPSNPPSTGANDNFKDDDGDGLNDNIKKPPETVKKKRESNSDDSKDESRSR
jgi:hypothetical protein